MNLRATLAQARAQLEYYLPTVVARHLFATPHVPAGAPKAWLPRGADGGLTKQQFPLPGGRCVPEFMGFTATGVVVGLTTAGLQTREFKELPVEDLQLLDEWMGSARDNDIFPGAAATA